MKPYNEMKIELSDEVAATLRANTEAACQSAQGWRGCVGHRPELEELADTYAKYAITLCGITAEFERLNAGVQVGRVTQFEAGLRTVLLGLRHKSVLRALEEAEGLLRVFHDASFIGSA